jgi:HK97 family phage major capsid protein
MLKQLKIMKALELKRSKLQEVKSKNDALVKRSEDAKKALEESASEEDLKVVEAEITEIEKEEATLKEEIKTIEEEITTLEEELEEVEERSKSTSKKTSTQSRSKGDNENMNRSQVRELLRTGEYYKRPEVIEFYEKFKNLRAVTGGELTIPDTVVSRIMDTLGDYSTLYPLVDTIRVKGTARLLLDVDTSAASWVEQNAEIPVGDVGTVSYVDFDGYKVGKIVFCDSSLIADSIINIDEYVSKKIARSIALALDASILVGTGVIGKQPSGILPAIPAENKVTVDADTATVADYVKPVGLIDSGTDTVGDIYAVMRRSTYYNYLLELSINVNAEGEVVGRLPNLTQPDLLGIPVVFNNNMGVDEILYGEFDKYTLLERENITIDTSTDFRFQQDQVSFRGKGRFDGKPTKPEAFVLLTITPSVVV